MSHPEYGTNEIQTLKLGHQQIESAAGTPFFNIGEGTNIDEKGQEKQNKSYTFHCHDASEG
jgi:hypothetical protein